MIDIKYIKTSAEVLQEMRMLLSAITREASHRGAEDVVDLAGRADELAAQLLHRETN